MMTPTLTTCPACEERPCTVNGYCEPCDKSITWRSGTSGLWDALYFLPLEVILTTIRDHVREQVGPAWTRRERELSCVSDDLTTTLRETSWRHLE